MAVYAVLALAKPALLHLDASVFIVAGDRFVDADRTPTPLIIRRGADGYDGQFYYRMALRPWSFATEFDGVRFDDPAYRMRRIGYPALAWAASLGDPSVTAIALLGVNGVGIFAVAALAALVCAEAGLAPLAAVAIVAWPGFIVALTHDTAEIVATAFILASVLARVRGRVIAHGALAATAMLTRETAAPLFFGMMLHDAWTGFAGRGGRAWAAAGMAALLPMLVWHAALLHLWRDAPGGSGLANLGWPFVGALRALAGVVTHAKALGPTQVKDAAARGIMLATTAWIFGVCALAARRVRLTLGGDGVLPPLAVGWCLTAALMSLLTADGPWVDVTGVTRAFTECHVIGCLVAAGGGVRSSHPVLLGLTAAALLAGVWLVCLSQMRGG